MLKFLDTIYKLFTPAEAEKIAKEMQENDPDWKYIVNHDPTGKGFSFIEVYDEDGQFVERV